MSGPRNNVIVVGAGIGGLCAARALERRGIPVCLYERAAQLRPLGAGLILSANAMGALGHLDLAAAVQDCGVILSEARLCDPNGRTLNCVSFADLQKRLGHPTVAVRRGTLQNVLLGAIKAPITLNAAAIGITQHASHVAVHFEQHNDAEACIVVGADGLNSHIRSTLWGAAAPRYAGYACWRGIASGIDDGLFPSGLSTETWGRGQRFGAVSLGSSEVYWFAVVNQDAGRVMPGKLGHDEVLRRFGAWHAPIKQIIDRTDPNAVLYHDLYDRPPGLPWGREDTTLLGDAAHPITPNLGQGAGLCIEDAVVLAHAVHTHGPTATALRFYEKARYGRTRDVCNESFSLGRVAQSENRLACWLRNGLLRSTPTWLAARRIRRVVTFAPPAEPA